MIEIYIADTVALADSGMFQHYMGRVDETRRQKVFQCKTEEDRKRSLLAGYLIQTGMKDRIGGESGGLADTAPLSLSYSYGENGKPYFKDYQNISFSLSHSGNYVAAAFDNDNVGIDIQYKKKARFDVAERFFSTEDKVLLHRLGEEESGSCFYELWAVKEAYMKLTGEGLRQGLDRTAVEPDCEDRSIGRIRKKNSDEAAFYRLCNIVEKYSIAVCSYSKISDIKINEVELTDEKL